MECQLTCTTGVGGPCHCRTGQSGPLRLHPQLPLGLRRPTCCSRPRPAPAPGALPCSCAWECTARSHTRTVKLRQPLTLQQQPRRRSPPLRLPATDNCKGRGTTCRPLLCVQSHALACRPPMERAPSSVGGVPSCRPRPPTPAADRTSDNRGFASPASSPAAPRPTRALRRRRRLASAAGCAALCVPLPPHLRPLHCRCQRLPPACCRGEGARGARPFPRAPS